MFHRLIASLGALIAITVSSPSSAETKKQLATSSIEAHPQLWTYQADDQYGETPDERLSCGQAALELGRSILEDWGYFWCGALDEATNTRECAVRRKPPAASLVAYERGARLWVDERGQHYLVMAYRRDISDVSFAELRRQRAFLDRIEKVGCKTRGPWKVWHPKKRSPFALKIERRLVKGDRSLLPREPRLRKQDRGRVGIHDGRRQRRRVRELRTKRAPLRRVRAGHGDGVQSVSIGDRRARRRWTGSHHRLSRPRAR